MVMSIIAAQTEQLLTFQTHGVDLPSLGQRVQLTIYGGESHFHAFVFQLAMQILCGNEFITRLQSIMNQFFLLGIALHASVCQSTSILDDFARRPILEGKASARNLPSRFYFKSSQQPVCSRSATVCLVSLVSTVI